MPGALVAIGWNGPRISAGALGLGSQVSIWLGPPTRNSMIQLTSRSLTAPAAFWAIHWGNVSPSAAREPACRKSRRVRPSQKDTGRSASKRNIGLSPSSGPQEGRSEGNLARLLSLSQKGGKGQQKSHGNGAAARLGVSRL